MTTSDKIDLYEKLTHALLGTCESLVHILDQHDHLELEDDAEFLEYLDNQIFNCETCGWWCEISEMSETLGWSCTDCSDDE